MPFETGTSRFFAKVDFTRCCAHRPIATGMTKKRISALTGTDGIRRVVR
jgi:hypothetical protein